MDTAWVQVLLTVIGVLLIPVIVVLVRGAIKWTRVEDKLDRAVGDLHALVADKDRVHAEMISQMREDRAATNTRLRWLEEHLWRQGTSSRSPGRRDKPPGTG